jgi:hypothetical protein
MELKIGSEVVKQIGLVRSKIQGWRVCNHDDGFSTKNNLLMTGILLKILYYEFMKVAYLFSVPWNMVQESIGMTKESSVGTE